MTNLHSTQTVIHRVHEWEHANAAARTGETVTSDDIGKISWQQDTDVFYVLGDTGPDWLGLSGGTGTQGDTGIQGDTGADSTVQGDTGDQGDTGADSTVQGDTGIQGDTGDQGDTGIGNTSGSTNIPTHTDTTWYTILTIPTVSDTALTLDAIVSGHTDDVATAAWSYQMLAYTENDGGTLTVGNNTPTPIIQYDAAYDVQMAVSGTNALIQVRRNGGSDYDIDWAAMVQVASF